LTVCRPQGLASPARAAPPKASCDVGAGLVGQGRTTGTGGQLPGQGAPPGLASSARASRAAGGVRVAGEDGRVGMSHVKEAHPKQLGEKVW
jgi:hypothetical protein